jgi:hypothetical protein
MGDCGEGINCLALLLIMMTQDKATEIAKATTDAVANVVKAQIAKGAPNRGLSKARHAAIVADVTSEILGSFFAPKDENGDEIDESKWQRLVMRAMFSTSLLNASQLRQELEKAKVLEKDGALNSEYGVDD